MPHAPSGNPATALLAALRCESLPELRRIAAQLVQTAVTEQSTIGEAATSLGIGRRTLERIRAEFGDLLETTERVSVKRPRRSKKSS